MSTQTPNEPTAEQCSAKASLGDGFNALWYPQMGGYAGKAVIRFDDDHAPGGCLDVWVWHDGEFPFSDGDEDGWTGESRRPTFLHHCDADQFRKFAEDVNAIEQAAIRASL